MRLHPCSPYACILAGLLVPITVAASQHSPAPPDPPAAVDAGDSMPAGPADPFDRPVDASSLDARRGGANTTSIGVVLDGDVGGNSATDVVTGTNTIQDGAFGNATGIATIIQNSGNNVLIQNSTVVNVRFADPAP